MNRRHRRWHRRIWWGLVPGLAAILLSAIWVRGTPADNAVLPFSLPPSLPSLLPSALPPALGSAPPAVSR